MTAPPRSSGPTRQPMGLARALGAVCGVVSGALTVAVADLVAGVVSPEATPVVAVGRVFIELTPGWLKDLAVERFGTNDKLALLLGMAVVIVALSAAAGVLSLRRRRAGLVLAAVLDTAALLAAVSRPDSGRLDALPTVVGALCGLVTLWWLAAAVRRTVSPWAGVPDGEGRQIARRRLVLGLAAGTGLAATAAIGGRVLAGRSAGLDPSGVRLPTTADGPPALPAGTVLDVAGLTPFVTSNRDFYRIDTALLVPKIDARAWRLRVHGLVERELVLSYEDLLALPLVERTVTLTCVSNEVGGTLAGNATWLGHPLAQLLAKAGPRPEADMVLSSSGDGFTVSTPLTALTDGRDALLAVGMNGAALPAAHGFPVRMVVPGLYGYVSATKWVVDLEVTRFDRAKAYWTQRGYAAQAPIRTFSRVDVPRPFAQVRSGTVAVAGVAWAQHRGIAAVEVRVDGGPWHAARLAGGASAQAALEDMWRQWVWSWDAAPGTHLLEVRATDGDGKIQPQQRSRPAPDGATGWHSVSVTVT